MPGDLRSPFDPDRIELVERIGRLVQGVEDHETILRLGVELMVPGFAEIAILLTADDGAGEQLRIAHAEPALQGWVADRVRSVLPALRSVASHSSSSGGIPNWLSCCTNCRSARF